MRGNTKSQKFLQFNYESFHHFIKHCSKHYTPVILSTRYMCSVYFSSNSSLMNKNSQYSTNETIRETSFFLDPPRERNEKKKLVCVGTIMYTFWFENKRVQRSRFLLSLSLSLSLSFLFHFYFFPSSTIFSERAEANVFSFAPSTRLTFSSYCSLLPSERDHG